MSRIRYSDVGVDYERLDPFKEMALELFKPTLKYPERLGVRIVPSSGGMTASVFDVHARNLNLRMASNVEGLGTKNLIADELYAKANIADTVGKYRGYTCVGQDTVAMSVNDLTGVGADPIIYGDIIAVGDDKWFDDPERCRALLWGYRNAADLGQFAIPLGETPALKGIIEPGKADLAGASIGIVDPPERYTDGSRIMRDDAIFGLSAPGPNANGITKIRRVAERLKDGYFAKIDGESTLADGVLVPTPIYSRAVIDMFDAGVEIHWLQPITGHGWAKIARTKADWTYRICQVPKPPRVFTKLIKWGEEFGFDVGNEENYKVWNMGIGFIVIAPGESGRTINECAKRHSLESYHLGRVIRGRRKVVMEPFGFSYTPK